MKTKQYTTEQEQIARFAKALGHPARITYSFRDVREVMGKANEAKSGDQLCGVAAETPQERVAARIVLSALTVRDICCLLYTSHPEALGGEHLNVEIERIALRQYGDVPHVGQRIDQRDKEGQEQIDHQDGNDDFGAESGPVSYTHLDVYKRQPRLGAAEASCWSCARVQKQG